MEKGVCINEISTYARTRSPVGLALSCVLAAIALCFHPGNQLLVYYELKGVADLFVGAFLVGVVALCVAVLVSSHDEEQRRWSIGMGLGTGGLGVVFGLFAQALPSAVSALGSGALLGFGLTCLLRQWGRYYRLLSFRGALLNTMLSFLAAACLWFAVGRAGTPFLFCLGMLTLVFCGGLPLLARQIVLAGEAVPGTVVEAWAKPLATMPQVMRMGWAAVAGLMLNSFVIGLTLWSEAPGSGTAGDASKLAAYALVMIVVAIVFVRAGNPTGGALELFYRIALPLAATIMLIWSFVMPLGPSAHAGALSVVPFLGAAVCNVLGLVILFWAAKCSDVGFSKVFASFCTTCAASMAAGLVAFRLAGEHAQLIWSSLLAFYLVAMVVNEAVEAAGRHATRVAPTQDDLRDLVEEAD